MGRRFGVNTSSFLLLSGLALALQHQVLRLAAILVHYLHIHHPPSNAGIRIKTQGMGLRPLASLSRT
jgi:hypothetical protein